MTVWAQWPKAKDLTVRAEYLLITGESIQATPLENEQGTHYLVGSWRLTPTQRGLLEVRQNIPGLTFHDNWPAGW